MKSMLALALVAAVVAVVVAEEPILKYYHDHIGIPEAARIKAAEEAVDFDGSRIVGGSTTNIANYPFLGGLVIALTTGGTSVCGSSLLSNTRVVTAAHCWWDGVNQARQFTVVLGSSALFSGGTRIATSNVQMHASWVPRTLQNDIAIITISWASYTNVIQPISLPTGSLSNNNFAGTWVQAAGFGRTSDSAGISTSQTLSHVTLQVITNNVCAQTYGSSAIFTSTICTSGVGGVGTCGGDSGGPVSITSGSQRVLVGVVSFGAQIGCQRGFPAGHARVTYFLSWIQQRL